MDIANCCRSIFPEAIIIAGGGIPTNLYEEIFKATTSYDALCYGEGEKPLLDLVRSENKMQHFEENPAWITPKKVKAGNVFRHDLIENLDDIPFLDYDLLENSDYGMNPLVLTYAGIDNKQQSFHVMTSRGCPHLCCFCSSHTVHGRGMRYYSLERVKEDFTRLKNQYHAMTFITQDDHLANIKKRTLNILDIIKELGVTAVFQNGIALYTLERELLEAYKGVGVNQLVLAVESGSNRVLKEIIHKPLDLSIVKRVADDCRDLDIYTDVNILIGFPGETKKDIEDTREFLKTINANWFRLVVATPLVGSEMFDICIEKGYLKHGYIDCNYKKAVVDTEEFTADWIQEKAYLLNLELNFVCNSDVKFGRYRIALKGFENAIKAKSDHAIAYYCAAKCYKELGECNKAKQYMDTARTIIESDIRWKSYADMFNIVVENDYE